MKITNKTNVLYLLVILLCASLFFNGCGGGGGGSVSSQALPGGGTPSAAGPSITIEGDIDPASLGLDLSSFSQAPSRAGADGASRFAVVVVENKAYKTLRKKLLKSPSDKANYAPARGAENFDALLNSGAVISSGTGSLDFNAGKFSYKLNVPITNSSPNGTLMFVDKTNGFPFGSRPIGTLPSINDQIFGNTGSGTGSTTTPASGGGAVLNIIIDPYMGGVIIRGFGAGTIADNNSSAIKITSSVFGSKITIDNGGGVSVAYSGTGNYTVVNTGVYLEMTIDRAGAGSTITNNSSFPLKIGSAEGNLTIAGTGNVIINNAANTNISNTPKVNNIKVGGFNINNTTTAQGFFNIENDICSNINFINSNSIIKNNNLTGSSSVNGTITLDSSDGNYLNTGAINKVINNNVGANNILWFGEALRTVNHSWITPKLPDTTKNSIYSNFISTEDMLSGTLKGFVYCVSDSSISNINSGFPSSININGTTIDSRSGQYLLDSVISGTKSTNTDTRIPELSSVIASPASAVTGEAVNLSFRSNVELADIPRVFICGRKANVLKTSSFDYAAWVLLSPSDSVFTFYIDSIIGVNGKQGAAVGATTDGSSVSIMQTAVEVPAPVATPPAGIYEGSVTVELSTQTPGAIIYYTQDAQTQPIYGTKYSAPIVIENFMSLPLNSTIRAVAVLDGKVSTTIRADYKVMPKRITAAAPFFSVPGGRYNRGIMVEIYSPTYGAQFRYTLDGSQPSRTNGTLYTASFNISKSVTLKAISFGDGMDDSKIVSVIYEFGEETLAPVAAPVIAPASGLYKGPQAVSISCATAGASIRYTLDGSKPSFSAGNLYSSSFVVTKTSQVRAIAFKTGMADSDIASSSIEITGEAEIKPPVTGIAEIEPKRDGTQVNSDFNIALAAPSGAIVTATLGSANALAGVTRVVASGGLAVLPVGVSGLAEGVTSEIRIKAVGAGGETVGELVVAVKKDTVAPRREKMSVASSNQGGASIAELGDRIVISLLTDEPVKNVVATMMGKPVTVRNTDDRNWTIARYLDGTEDSSSFDFIINFTDLAGNSAAYPLTKKDINEGAPLMLKIGAGNSAFNIFRKDGVNKLYLSAVPPEMEYCLDGASEVLPGTWFAGKGAEVDLSGVSGKYIFVRQKGVAISAQCLGKIIGGPAYGIDENNLSNRWAFDASTGAVILTNLSDGVNNLDESKFSIHIYSGKNPDDGQAVMDYYLDPIAQGSTGKVGVPSFIKSSWTAGEYVSFYLKTNNGTQDITRDDIYVQPAAGVAVKKAPVNSAEVSDGNFIYDGRSNSLVFVNSGGSLTGASVLAGVSGGEPVKLSQTQASASAVTYRLPFEPPAGNELAVAVEYKDRSVSGTAKLTVSGAPQNLADGFGNFSIKALLGQISVTNFDSARDGYTAFASIDNGVTWKELGRISSNVGQNFNVTLTAASKVKLAMRDTKGNFSPTQADGVSPMAAPANEVSGDRAFLVLGHAKKLEVNNSTGAMNGFNILYSFDGGVNWSSTAAVTETGRQRLELPEFILSGSKIKVALLEWKTGNASFASDDYILKAASNRSAGAADGDYVVKASEKKVYLSNSSSSLNGFEVFINGASAGKIGSTGQSFPYTPNASNEVSLYYADFKGNTWLESKSKPVAVPRNNNLADGDFFVNAAEGRITFKNAGGTVSGLVPMVSADGGLTWKELGPALAAGGAQFQLAVKAGASVAAAFKDADGNVGASSEPYLASGPKLNTPVKMLLAGDGGVGAKAGLIVESGKPAVKLRPGVALKNGETLKVTLSNGGSVTMTAKVSGEGVVPVFGESTPGVVYEAVATGNGNAATGSFNLNNPGGTPVSIIGTIEVAAVHSDILGNVSPVSKVYITADQTPPLWAAGYPSLSAPAYFKLKAGLRTNEDGKIYLVCLKASEASPTAAQIKIGQNASGAAVAVGMKASLDFTVDGGAITHEFAGLDNNTEYAVHAVAEDGYENLQAQPVVVKMKTLNNVAPMWVSGYPAVSAPEFNKLKAAFRMNETGSVYLACLKSGLASLTAAQVKTGTDASGAALNASMKAVIAMTTADSEAVHIFGGLESAVEYDIYAVAADEYGETQANPTIVKMKTIDDLPPVWSSGYPQGQPTGYTSLRFGASADKKAFVHAVCLPLNAPEPTVAQVMAGKNASDIELASNLRGTVEIAANAAGYINFTNLAVGTPYDIYSIAMNEYGIAQAAVSKTRVNTIAFTPPSFQVQYYSDAGMLTEIADTPVLKAGTYYLKITANVSLNAPPKVFITTEAAVNNISDFAATHVEGNRIYKLTRTISSDAAAVGSVQEVIEISATSSEGVSVTKLKPSNLSTKGAFIDTVAPAGTVAYTKSGGFYENTDFTPARQYVKNGDNFTATFTYTEGIKSGVTPKFKVAKPDTTQVIYADMTPDGDRTVWTYNVANLAATAGEEFLPTVTIEGAIDKAGNPASYTFTKPLYIDNKGPMFTPVTIASNNANTAWAKTGNTVALSFTAGEKLNAAPVVKFKANGANERTATIGGPTVLAYTATYTMQNTDEDGAITFTLNAADMVGNAATQVTAVTSGSGVTFDKTVPTWIATYPKAGTVTSSSIQSLAKVGETGKLYYVAWANAPAADPTAAQIRAGNNSEGSAATKSGNFSVTANNEANAVLSGLSSSTTYKIYCIAEDSAGNQSAVGNFSQATAAELPARTITGTIRKASDASALAGATVSLKNGSNAALGDADIATTTSAADGTYTLNTVDGNYTIWITCGGYVNDSTNVTVSGNTVHNSSLAATIASAGKFVIVLSWNTTGDVDSYTNTPYTLNSDNIIKYNHKNCITDGKVNLDVDDTDGYGPETTSIESGALDGTYTFDVKNVSAVGATATVKVFYNRTNLDNTSGVKTVSVAVPTDAAITIVKSGTQLTINGN